MTTSNINIAKDTKIVLPYLASATTHKWGDWVECYSATTLIEQMFVRGQLDGNPKTICIQIDKIDAAGEYEPTKVILDEKQALQHFEFEFNSVIRCIMMQDKVCNVLYSWGETQHTSIEFKSETRIDLRFARCDAGGFLQREYKVILLSTDKSIIKTFNGKYDVLFPKQ